MLFWNDVISALRDPQTETATVAASDKEREGEGGLAAVTTSILLKNNGCGFQLRILKI